MALRVKESTHNAGDLGLIPGLGRSPGEGKGCPLQYSWVSLVAQLVKILPAMWETWVLFLGWEDPLEKGTARLPMPVFWPGEFHVLYSPWGHKESDKSECLSLSGRIRFLHSVILLILKEDSIPFFFATYHYVTQSVDIIC